MSVPGLLILLAFAQSPGPWRTVEPAPGEAFEHPPWRALGLVATRPEDVAEAVAYRGRRRRYAQLRLGSPGSTRVTVVLDEVGPGEADLYVDADRDRKIEPTDRVDGRGRTWRVPVAAQFVEPGLNRHERHTLAFRLGASGRTLGAAVVGYREGEVRIGNQMRRARRTDADLDGSYASPDDRIWIDLDGDGAFDAAGEQFLYRPVLAIGRERYVVRGDRPGDRLALEPMEGTGTIALELRAPGLRRRVTRIDALLVGRDGTAVGVGDLGTEVDVPIGEYRLGALSVTLADPAGGPDWHFVFSEPFEHPVDVWHRVNRDRRLAIDPIGTLTLGVEITDPPEARRRGRAVTVQPRLTTGDGLVINAGYRGSPTAPGLDHATTSTVTLASADGRALDAVHSGFT